MSDMKLTDKINGHDELSHRVSYKPPVLTRTRIQGFWCDGENDLGEMCFETENQIVLGGSLFILEKIFGVQSSLTVDYLNNFMGIANTGTAVTEIYPKDTVVCLFGVGTGGAGDSSTSVRDVKFQEREIFDMVPFRVVATSGALTADERNQYWFKKTLPEYGNKVAYYLKKFDSNPEIKVLWKDGEGGEDGTAVENGVHTSQRTEPIETFIEITLKITKKDVREWFELKGQVEQTRINSIGLFTGIKSRLADGTDDYKQVKMFSKLNINNEMLNIAKDLRIVYRIYTS